MNKQSIEVGYRPFNPMMAKKSKQACAHCHSAADCAPGWTATTKATWGYTREMQELEVGQYLKNRWVRWNELTIGGG